MKWVSSLVGTLLGVAALAVLARFLGLGDFIRDTIASGHLLDWVMGALCLVWLLVLLKAPWDLYFEASAVAFEQERSREAGTPLRPGRSEYVQALRRRLGLFAVGAHLGSAALIAALSFGLGGRQVGYWFAAFFLVATLFRPLIAGYVYLMRKLRAVGQESRYPREDVAELRARVSAAEQTTRDLSSQAADLRARLQQEAGERIAEARELRERQSALAREFEATASRLTDNQEVIRGIQAFVRLISQSAVRGTTEG